MSHEDALVCGFSQRERDEFPERVSSPIGKSGYTLNKKCEFSTPSVKIAGQIINSSACRVDPDILKAIDEMNRTNDMSGTRSVNLIILSNGDRINKNRFLIN